MVRIPVACTLGTDEASDRMAEWRRFLVGQVVEVHRPSSTVARLLLREGDDVLLAAVDLARREKACCSFFTFAVEPLPGQTWLVAEVPAEGAEILDDLLGPASGPSAVRRAREG